MAKAYGAADCIGIALAGKSSNYQWKTVDADSIKGKIITLYPDAEQEKLSVVQVAIGFYRILRKEKIEVVFLPSYWPLRSLSLLLISKFVGIKCVMMNESHAGTERAKGLSKLVKINILKMFDSALLGGSAQISHFKALGMPEHKLFAGYDVVNNAYFSQQAEWALANRDTVRFKLGLPDRYILNLGRMVKKKNLSTLIQAYALLLASPIHSRQPVSLLLVGSGEEEKDLRMYAESLGLKVRDLVTNTNPKEHGTVYFGGFRNIEENPLFFSLASVFVLPSTTEEWGLVVNEAMACSKPVIVSETAGCSYDLVIDGGNGYKFDPNDSSQLAMKLETTLSDEKLLHEMGKESESIISNWSCQLFADNAIKSINCCFDSKI